MAAETEKRSRGQKMSLVFFEKKPAPTGVHNAICVEVGEPEIVTTNFGDRPVIRIDWEIEATNEEGRRHRVGRTFTASTHPKSNLGQFLETWLGKIPTHLKKDMLVGRRAYLVVIHEIGRNGNTYAKILRAMPADGQNTLTL
jgi:hypothetical protein